LDAFHLSQEHTRNFFGEESLKNNIKNAKKKDRWIKKRINASFRNIKNKYTLFIDIFFNIVHS
jgi:hypothetical protein